MPTGYTSKLYNGEDTQSFSDFVLQCAHAFIVDMRNMSMDAEIPVAKPSSYHIEALEKAEAEFQRATSMSAQEATVAAQNEFDEAMKHHNESEVKRKALFYRYNLMLLNVHAWKPPTTKHEGLKKFMIEQLSSSIEFDCRDMSKYKPTLESGDEYLIDLISSAERDIEYHTQKIAGEIERTEKNNAWVRDLKESIK